MYILPFIAPIAVNPPVWVAMLLWLVMGMGISGIGMSVMHDANHGAFSKNAAINKWMSYTTNLAGAGVLNWKLQHNILHHTYTNVHNVDETTVNFSPRNKLLSWYICGLNFQIEHHLFPKVCHVHYPKLAPIVKQTASEFGLTYLENKSFFTAVSSHIESLKRFGAPKFDEAIV
ncbi:fatty acid desaturase [Dyadobacter sp. CY327]|uniref:fatty acid desaturase family protein n=1 Tax=Dyadobacter sp. CY327 TaxID=2907301 RepID=UPI00286D9C12|nr:fatty acid desaturase [Dyadobacter sp. CY327]